MVAARAYYPFDNLRLRHHASSTFVSPPSAPRSVNSRGSLSSLLAAATAAASSAAATSLSAARARARVLVALIAVAFFVLLSRPPPPPPISGLPASRLFSLDDGRHPSDARQRAALRARYTAPISSLPPHHHPAKPGSTPQHHDHGHDHDHALRDPHQRELHLPPLYSRPATFFNRGARFMLYTASYGQFNNQVVSLINALLIARRLDAVLVLPYVRLGKESKWDAAGNGLHDEMRVTRQLVGDYFNYSHLLLAEHVVQPHTFFRSPDGRDLLDWRNLTVAFRAGGYYRSLVKHASRDLLRRKRVRPTVLAPAHDRRRLDNFCDFSPYSLLRSVNEQGRNGRFVLLPVVFRRHNLNCSEQEPRWVSVRRHLVPRDEFLRAVDNFVTQPDHLPAPTLAVHLRFFLNGDAGNFTARSFVDMMFRDYGTQLAEVRSLFVAYSPSSEESRQVVAMLHERFHGVVRDGRDFAAFFRKEDAPFAKFTLSAVLFDLWVCVRSHMFLGRLGSSLSWNVVYWRQALWKELGLSRAIVQDPLWYELENFTTRGMSRKEGPIEGVQLARD